MADGYKISMKVLDVPRPYDDEPSDLEIYRTHRSAIRAMRKMAVEELEMPCYSAKAFLCFDGDSISCMDIEDGVKFPRIRYSLVEQRHCFL